MRYMLEIQCDNAAFEGDPAAEIARILRACADRVALFSFAHKESRYPLKDVNGNTCGSHGYVNDSED